MQVPQNMLSNILRFSTKLTKQKHPEIRRVLCAYPRSGTHWLKNMISYTLGTPPVERRFFVPNELIMALKVEASKRLIYEHFDFDVHGNVLNIDMYPDLRIILLYRNPSDVLISQFYKLESENLLANKNITAMENLKLYLRDFQINSDIKTTPKNSSSFFAKKGPLVDIAQRNMFEWFNRPLRDTVRRYLIDWFNSGCFCPVRYEDLILDTKNQLSRILDFLKINYSSRILEEAVARNRFEVLSGGRSPGVEDVSSHYRKGLPGEWRKVFNTEDMRIVRRQIGDYIEFLGYPLE